MKKNSFAQNFIIGGCIGTTLIIVSYVVTNVLMGNITQEIINIAKTVAISFLGGSICFTIATKSINTIENKDTKSITRQKLLKIQLIAISIIITYFSALLIIFVIKNNSLNIILSLSFIIAFGLWEYGCMLAYLNLKNNMVMINKRKSKN